MLANRSYGLQPTAQYLKLALLAYRRPGGGINLQALSISRRSTPQAAGCEVMSMTQGKHRMCHHTKPPGLPAINTGRSVLDTGVRNSAPESLIQQSPNLAAATRLSGKSEPTKNVGYRLRKRRGALPVKLVPCP
jgi:hypothetical protein